MKKEEKKKMKEERKKNETDLERDYKRRDKKNSTFGYRHLSGAVAVEQE